MITYPVQDLLALAESMRGPEWCEHLSGALLAAQFSGWDDAHRFRFVFRMLLDEDASPRDLTEAARDPVRKTSPGDYAGWASAIREALADRAPR